MAHKITFANQKGGVGKTSITLHTSGALAELGKRVLAIDMDQQGNLSSVFIDNIYQLPLTVADLLDADGSDIEEVIQKTSFENINILPANLTLSDLDARLAGDDDSQYYLLEHLEEIESQYDYILIDCPPSLGRATRISLVASNSVIIPIECQEWAVKGSAQLTSYIDKVQKRANPELELLGFVINRFDARRSLEQSYKEVLIETFANKIFKAEFHNNVQYAEASTARQPITSYLPASKQAESFREFVKEIIAYVEKR
jgi:chromosome partitioning protein